MSENQQPEQVTSNHSVTIAGDVQQWKKNMVGSYYGLSGTKIIPFSSGIAFSMAKPNSPITSKKPRRIDQWVENT